MRGALVVATVVAASSTAFAQPAPTPAEVLAHVQATYALAKDVQADFTQLVHDPTFGRDTPSAGTLYLSKPRFRFDYATTKNGQSTPRTTYLYDATDLWVVDHLNKRVLQYAVASSNLPAVISFWTGGTQLAKDFNVAFAKPGAYGPAGATILELVPKQPSAAYTKVVFVIDPKAWTVTQSITLNSSNVMSTFTFAKVNTAATVKPTLFKLDPKALSPLYQVQKAPTGAVVPTPGNTPATGSSPPPKKSSQTKP